MNKQYSIAEFIDILTQARTHIERGEMAAASVAAQQAALETVNAQMVTVKKHMVTIDGEYRQKIAALEAMHAQRMQQLDAQADARMKEIDAAAAERTATHQRIVRDLQAQSERLEGDVRSLTAKAVESRQQLESVQAVLSKTKEEAQKFSALLS